MANRPYRAHEMLVGPARGRPELWRLVAGVLLAMTVAFMLGVMLRTMLITSLPGIASGAPDEGAGQGNTPASLLLLLFGFGLVTMGVFVAARTVQQRDPLSLIGPIPLAISQFWRVFRALVLLGAVILLLPPYGMGEPLVPNLNLGTWIMLLPISLLAVLVQTSSEEILFRGYIQQTLAARFSSPLVWLVVPALLFGLGHYLPAEAGDNAIFVALWAVVFGLLAADLTARSGTLGPAIALHMANNVTAILIVSVPDSLSGLSLATTPYSISDTGEMRSWLVIDFTLMLVSWLAARVALRR